MDNIFDIRYTKLHFTIQFLEDCELSASKTSALRGGMGEMLLRANCVRNRKCETCDFSSECIVQRTMYSQFEKKPAFVTSGESIGYVLECENYDHSFNAGDLLDFQLILFGRTIVYFSQFVQAFYALGQSGLGNGLAHYRIVSILNSRSKPILKGTDMDMGEYRIGFIRDYISYRLKRIQKEGWPDTIVFHTPLSQKYQGAFLEELDFAAVLKSIQRRVFLLDCFEGLEGEDAYRKEWQLPKVLSQESRPVTVYRYSSRHRQEMPLHGIKGYLVLEDIPEEMLPLLLAGELVHIGKNTSFGFGRYTLTRS
ncbi:MAG: CRISPR system precrRNA processing endoribonuclease RAMP protein Cas6 [Lachnospiraceae bacterium]|nr:CRISPR system precrRNA processing endoribonuclease RAMP protein Cas6 [Lachnospiraceae bacterium]